MMLKNMLENNGESKECYFLLIKHYDLIENFPVDGRNTFVLSDSCVIRHKNLPPLEAIELPSIEEKITKSLRFTTA